MIVHTILHDNVDSGVVQKKGECAKNNNKKNLLILSPDL